MKANFGTVAVEMCNDNIKWKLNTFLFVDETVDCQELKGTMCKTGKGF